jgi:hypothetical protein
VTAKASVRATAASASAERKRKLIIVPLFRFPKARVFKGVYGGYLASL